jgi:chromosome segregation ATPase
MTTITTMGRVLISWCLSWFRTASLDRRLSYLDHKVARLRSLAGKAQLKLKIDRADLESSKMQFDEHYNRAKGNIQYAESVNKKLDEGLEALQEQLHTANEITIPALVQANEIITGRWKAEQAILAMRTGMAGAAGVDE